MWIKGGYQLNERINKIKNGFKLSDELLDTEYNNLSGGEKQKIALARAYVSNKKIFVLDESLSAIDADSAKDILNDLLSRKDITLIMISHGTEQSVLDRFTKVIQL